MASDENRILVPSGSASIHDMQRWLRENKVKHEPVTKPFGRYSDHLFVFRYPEDAVAFKLRWL